MPLKVGKRDLVIDLGAEKLLIAERANQKIAVEVKSFISASPVSDLEQALGQYLLYEDLIRTQYPDRILYLAIRWQFVTRFTLAFFKKRLCKSYLKAVI